MKFGHFELFVTDPLTSLPFYRDMLGFDVVAVQAESFVWLKLGEQEVLLRPGRPLSSSPTYSNSRIGIVLYTHNLLETVETLRQRGLNITCMPDEESCYNFTDLDGNWFQLVDPTGHL